RPAPRLSTTRAKRRLPLLHSKQRLLAPSSAAYTFHLAAIARWATGREEHQLVLMWLYVQTTRFTETRGVQTADHARRPKWSAMAFSDDNSRNAAATV